MHATIRPQSAAPQCCVCYCADPAQLTQVCVDCGQALCQKHSRPTLFSRFLGWLDFGGINRQLSDDRPIPYCPTCCNRRFAPGELWRNLLLAARLLWLPVGAADFRWPALATAPELALTLQEELSGSVQLGSDGMYTPSPPAATASGKLVVKAFFTRRDLERMQAYRQRFHLPAGRAISIRAGFARFAQTTNLQLNGASPTVPLGGLLITSSPADATLPPLARAKSMSSKEWEVAFDYSVRRVDTQAMPLPVQLVASFVPEADAEAIELRVQLRGDIKRWMNLEAASIDRLELTFPTELGSAQRVSPKPVSPSKTLHTMSYPPPSLVWEDAGLLKPDEPAASFHLQFAHPCSAPITLTGEVKLTCKGLLSQQENVGLFYAWGASYPEEPKIKRKTNVTIRFQLTVDPAWLQHPYKLDPHGYEQWNGLAPDDDFVLALLDRLAADGLYVRSVAENQAHVSPTHASASRLLWELAGRQYAGLVPLDFHIELAGEVMPTTPAHSFLRADVTVQVPANHLELRKKAQALHDQIMAQIAAQVKRVQEEQADKSAESTPTFTEAAKTTTDIIALLVKKLQDLGNSDNLTKPA